MSTVRTAFASLVTRLGFGALLALAVASPAAQIALAQGSPGAPAKPPARKPQPDPPGKKAEPPADKPEPTARTSGVERWTDATPDDVVRHAIKRAEGGGDDAVAGLLLALAMIDHAPPNEVLKAFHQLAKSGGAVGNEARMLAQMYTPVPFGKSWEGWATASFDVPKDATGLVRAFTVVGPFQDPGGGLLRQEGPEAPGASFADANGDYSWGDFEVKPRRMLPDWITAFGAPLDLYVHPRTESCTYVATKVSFPDAPKSVVMRVAAAGTVRVIFDGETVAWSEDVNPRAILDRLAMVIELDAGPHLVAIKVCSSPQPDDGRVRVRFTDAAGAPIAVEASSNLTGIADERVHGLPLPEALARKALLPSKPPAGPKPGDPAAPKGKPPAASPKLPPPPPLAPAPTPRRPKAPAKVTKLKWQPLKTPLQRALEGGDASLDQAIVGAVARTLAGADDTRSPRAPGLLDRVAKHPNVTPDQLALAGWLSAFGANKSGWLNQAIERGTKNGDPRAASFARRRLAEALMTGGAMDAALRLTQKPPFAEDKDVSARVLRASLLGRTRSQLDALTALMAIDDELKQKLPHAALRELASFSMAKPELRLAYLRRLAQATIGGRDTAFAYAALIDGNAAFERAAAAILPHTTSARTLHGLSNALHQRGRYVWAREIAFVATKAAPNLAESWESLASAREAVLIDERASGSPATDADQFALQARRRSLALRRGDAQKKAELAFREGAYENKKGDTKTKGDDERFLAVAAPILERAKKNPAKIGEVFERTLHFQRIVTYHSDKRVSQLIHQAREIIVEPRTPNELYERNVPQEGDQVELVLRSQTSRARSVLTSSGPSSRPAMSSSSRFARGPASLSAGEVTRRFTSSIMSARRPPGRCSSTRCWSIHPRDHSLAST